MRAQKALRHKDFRVLLSMWWGFPRPARADRMSASLIGRLGSSAFRLSTNSSVDVAHGLSLLFGLGTKGPSIMGFEDEVEQSFGRPCRQCDCRFKRTYELTSSIVPRGHHSTVGWSSISSYCVGSCTDLKLLRLPWSTGIRCRQPTRGA